MLLSRWFHSSSSLVLLVFCTVGGSVSAIDLVQKLEDNDSDISLRGRYSSEGNEQSIAKLLKHAKGGCRRVSLVTDLLKAFVHP